MTIPDYQSLMLPVLQQAMQGEVRVSEVVDQLGQKLKLSEGELAQLLPSGKQTIFANRVHWAKTYLKQAGLIESTRRGHFSVTERGRQVVASRRAGIDRSFLEQFPEFRAFVKRVSVDSDNPLAPSTLGIQSEQTPDDLIRKLSDEINVALGHEIVERISRSSPAFFERVMISLLLSMGYGGSLDEAGRALGRAGDDGVDGVIDQDVLGLDRIYIQAKRYRADSAIGPAAIRDFFGSLDMHKANKGLFVTTSSFTKSAVETAERLGKRIVLIDGVQLARLLVKFNVGCRLEDSVEIKKIDEDFFE